MYTTVSSSAFQKTNFELDSHSYSAILFQSPDDPLFPEIVGNSIFLSKAYHKALNLSPPEKMKFWYVRLEDGDELVGMLCFQINDFNPGDSLKNQMDKNVFNKVRYKLASLINLKVLCLGNTLLTGDYGFCFKDHIPARLRTLLMMETIDWLLKMDAFKDIRMIFVKDFYTDIFKEIPDSRYCKKYHFIDTQPSMIMNITGAWRGLEGYMASLKSKYRIRAKRALQLAKGLEIVELTADEIEESKETLHDLYLKVVEDVGFNLFILSADYFTALKKALGDKFHLWVYKENGEIISFFTVFEDGEILDAHFLGYDPEVNHRYKLYLNMLLAMIDYASIRGFKQLQLSRTATEIKSSVGAEGVSMWAYLRFTSRFLNSWLPWVYSFFKPDMDWVRREPFHEVGR
jgi:hypothetical protein